MPRVKQVVAAKDYPQHGIKKGDKHYNWSLKTGPRSSRTFRQIAPPRPSQLTTSEFLGTIGDMRMEIDSFEHSDGLADTLRDFAERIGTLGEEQQEKFDNLPDGFQQAQTGELLQERADGCESWKEEIEQAADALDETLAEIEGKAWNELDEFNHHDPEDEDFDAADTPSEEEIESAREGERATAYETAIAAVTDNDPGL